jgi:hypothetical protein
MISRPRRLSPSNRRPGQRVKGAATGKRVLGIPTHARIHSHPSDFGRNFKSATTAATDAPLGNPSVVRLDESHSTVQDILAGTFADAVMVLSAQCQPGRSTRAVSASAASGSGISCSTAIETTASTVSSRGEAVARPPTGNRFAVPPRRGPRVPASARKYRRPGPAPTPTTDPLHEGLEEAQIRVG